MTFSTHWTSTIFASTADAHDDFYRVADTFQTEDNGVIDYNEPNRSEIEYEKDLPTSYLSSTSSSELNIY